MIQPPAYFEEIRREAAEHWETLSQTPKLAGAWHQLFKQVQNPRHVISELLQNADDAGATHASVTVEDGEFIFSHNGQDFEKTTFESLCNFAYSNKRTLHTIGFRGIGFKSIFSLGDLIELESPTLSVAFDHRRFTEPAWIGKQRAGDGQTSFRVKIKDGHRRSEISKSIRIWCESPSSLLFFRSLRSLRLGDSHVEWKTNGPGPAGQSEWLALNSSDSDPVLLIRSPPEQFPEEAIREIREERMVDTDDSPLPPCSVELLVGIEGELFVVLPTGVKTELPFACNAPFVQDPARLKIKNPEISPTNRWLLRRLGELAAKAMLDWLRTATLTTQERSRAYGLLTRFRPEDSSLEGSCESIVADAFHDLVVHRELLLTESGNLARSNECIAVPDWLNQVWSSEQTSKFFDEDKRPLFCQEVNRDARRRLIDAEYLEELPAESILVILQENHLPRPSSWRQLLILWDAVAPALSKGRYSWEKSWTDVRIVPVQGHECLHSAGEVVRLSEKRLLRADTDWEFLSQFLRVLNVNWPRYIAEQRRVADKSQNIGLAGQVQSAEKLLGVLSLTESSDAGLILERVAESFFGQDDDDRERSDSIRLAHIAAALGADAPENFKFITADDQLTSLSKYWLAADIHWDLREFVTDEWYDNYVIHEDYWQRFESCSREDWEQWITSGRSGLLQFPPIVVQKERLWRVDSLRERVEQRGGQVGQLPYKSQEFLFEDQDFDEDHWDHWNSLAEDDPTFWWKLVKRVCEQPVSFWHEHLSASVLQIATNGHQKTLNTGHLVPAWILKLRDLPCLQDTWGGLHHPAELFRRTAETESLFDIEPFVRAEIDTEAIRPLLVALGIRDKATDPTGLLERLRALATLSEPRVDEVLKWCRRLDALVSKCPTEEFERVRTAFHEQQLILTADGTWARVSEVFLGSGDSEVPGAPVVHPELRSLSIWYRIGVPERPTIDKILDWLRALPTGERLSSEDAKRVRELLPFHAERIWNECGRWLNLEGEWVEVDNLRYCLSMQSLFKWGTLFPQIKRAAADFQRLPTDLAGRPPFSELPSLAGEIHERVQVGLENGYSPEERPWLATLGAGLARMKFDSEEKTARVRQLGRRMFRTGWQQASQLEAVPYLDGTPAGTPRREDAFWDDSTLYIVQKPWTKLFPSVAQVLTEASDDQDLARAIRDCIDRSPQFINEYLEDHFDLAPPDECQPPDEAQPTKDSGVVDVISQGHPLEGDDEPDDDLPTDEVNPNDEPIDAEEQQPGQDDDQQDGRPRPPTTRPPKAPLIDRFAQSLGFKKDAQGRFYQADGRWIARASGHTFPWEMNSPDGDLLKCYWTKEHCLAREPLQLPSEVWQLCEDEPDKYSLVLVTPDDAPQEISGEQLNRMRVDGSLQLYPATYRLVLQGGG